MSKSKPLDSDHFSLFGLPAGFSLDDTRLEEAYFDAQRKFHPDRFAGQPDSERRKALQQSMAVNDAYQALKSPLKRAQYLLAKQGIRVNTESDTVKPSQSLLTEIMELREQLSDDPTSARELQGWLAQEIGRLTAALGNAFDAREYQKAAEMTLRLNYLTKLADDLRLAA